MTNAWRKQLMIPLALTCLYVGAPYAPAGAANPAVDVCTLVTVAEVEQIVGQLKTPPRLMQDAQARNCDYAFVNTQEALELWVFPGEALERAKKLMQRHRVPLTGFGAEAFLYRDAALGYLELWLKKGETVLQVALKTSSADEEKVKAIAQKALSRL
jgi:hypothetical protein